MHNHRNLKVWTRAIDLTEAVYRETESFPRHEVYGLTSQLRRAAVSISANIAEGAGRSTIRDFSRFLRIAVASCNEVETLAEIARRLELLDTHAAAALISELEEIRRMTHGLAAANGGKL